MLQHNSNGNMHNVTYVKCAYVTTHDDVYNVAVREETCVHGRHHAPELKQQVSHFVQLVLHHRIHQHGAVRVVLVDKLARTPASIPRPLDAD